MMLLPRTLFMTALQPRHQEWADSQFRLQMWGRFDAATGAVVSLDDNLEVSRVLFRGKRGVRARGR